MENGLIYTSRREGFWSFDVGSRIMDLSDTLLPVMTQDQSAKYSSPDGFSTCTAEQFFLVGSKLYEMKDLSGKDKEVVESARQFIRQGIRGHGLNTQTRISYSSNDQDAIIHGYGKANPVMKNVDFVGRDGAPDKVLSLESSLALTGKKPEEVNTIMSYLNNTVNYVWRVNSKPSNVDERVVRLDAYSDRFGLNCYRVPQDAGASFGVRVREKNSEGSH
ncbi:MAG: hypothetical protein AABX85_00515 [Nanoarchaeota archaeon]